MARVYRGLGGTAGSLGRAASEGHPRVRRELRGPVQTWICRQVAGDISRQCERSLANPLSGDRPAVDIEGQPLGRIKSHARLSVV